MLHLKSKYLLPGWLALLLVGCSPVAAPPTVTLLPTERLSTATVPAATATVLNIDSTATSPTTDSTATVPSTGIQTYQITQPDSKVSFSIYEELYSSPVTVIGNTNTVTGQVQADWSDLSNTTWGNIQIDAGSFVTDKDRRNQAIREFILQSNRYPTIIFAPTSSTLSGVATTGQTYTFDVFGDLTIRDQTKPATFTVTVLAESPTRLSGSAKAIINRIDFGLQIPSLPFLANVGETIDLQLDFVLTPPQ